MNDAKQTAEADQYAQKLRRIADDMEAKGHAHSAATLRKSADACEVDPEQVAVTQKIFEIMRAVTPSSNRKAPGA